SMIDRPETSAEGLGRMIEKDQVLSAKALQLANSPFYGFPARIASVSHAVVVLGLNVVKGLTLGATVFDMMKAAGMDQLWRHSLGVAMVSHLLATRVGQKNPEELFVAGLLHDLGKVVMYVKLPETASRIEAAVRDRDVYMIDAEREILGLTHADVAGWLASAWHLPTVLKETIIYDGPITPTRPRSAFYPPAPTRRDAPLSRGTDLFPVAMTTTATASRRVLLLHGDPNEASRLNEVLTKAGFAVEVTSDPDPA